MPPTQPLDGILEAIDIDGIDNAYVLHHESLERVLFNRNLIGLEFSDACEHASIAFLTSMRQQLVAKQLSELILLSKGLCYRFHNAFQHVFNQNLQANLMSTRRLQVQGDDAEIKLSYTNLDALTPNILIGDTVASGATICTALTEYAKHTRIDNVYIFTIAGSVIGGRRISALCRQMGAQLTIVYGLAAFGLADNGFDLAFLHPDTISNPSYIERAKQVFFGLPVSSAGWDFGTQAQAITKYKMLCWIEEKYWELENTGVFQEKEVPNISLVSKEVGAYSSRFPDLAELIAKCT